MPLLALHRFLACFVNTYHNVPAGNHCFIDASLDGVCFVSNWWTHIPLFAWFSLASRLLYDVNAFIGSVRGGSDDCGSWNDSDWSSRVQGTVLVFFLSTVLCCTVMFLLALLFTLRTDSIGQRFGLHDAWVGNWMLGYTTLDSKTLWVLCCW